MRAYKSYANLKAGPSNWMAVATAPRRAGPASRSVAQPTSLQRSGIILVVATVDSERYTKVDITDTLDNGAIIRKRILNKLGIWNQNEQEDSLIYETEIGALAIGEPLTDRQLSTISYERGDGRASLAFLVRRPTNHRPIPGNPPAHEVQTEGEAGDSDFSSGTADDAAHKRRRRRQNISPDKANSSKPTLPTRLDVTNLDVLRDYVTPSPSPLTPTRTLKSSKSVEFLRKGVRPLPPIPAPITVPHTLKSPASNANFHRSNGEPRPGGSTSHPPPWVGPHNTPTQHSVTRRVERDDNKPPSNVPRLQPPNNNQNNADADDPRRLKGPKSFEWKRGNLIGTGKYGPVYMALDSKTKSIIAVKQIEIPRVRQSDAGAASVIEALKQESEILQGLDHKNIVKYLRLEETSSVLNIFMEYVPGGTIRSCLTKYGPFAETITKSFTAQVLDGLAYLHSKQLVHRDLKAENILVEPNGICKISDFAISKHADNDGLVFTALQGSLFWMAPEVINTQKQGYNSKVDIWSLGCLVLEMWTGVRPWAGLKARDVMLKLYISELAPPIPEGTTLTDTAADLHKKCFLMNPDDRPTASQLQQHPYLILSAGWEFTGFKSKRREVGNSEKEVPLLETVTLRLPPQLDRFRIYSSKRESARQWLDASQEDLLDYVSSQDGLTLSDKVLCTDWTKNGVIYERFTIYIYEHLKVHHAATQVTTDHLSELRDCIQTWNTWDMVKAISKHRAVSDRLRAFPVWKKEERLQRIIALDIDSICVRLYLVLQDREQYQMLVDLPEEPSQMVLNLLQTLLDSPSLDPSFRSPFMNALLRVSRKTGLYPEVLLQNRVTLEGEDAVAAGQFGDVWKGMYEGQKVAVKVLKLYVQSDVTKHLKKVSYETLIWRQLRHRNVLPFLCLYYVNNNRARIGLVSPWMENGNVQQYLRQDPDADRISLVRDVAKGLEYLHTMQPSIVHGDLKAVNILITDTRRACLADFGLSTASQSQALNLSSFSAGRAGGTSRWTAPELLNGTQDMNNISSDVYAFGCVSYEIFSGNIPFHDINSDYPVILKVIQGIRPPRPFNCVPSGASCSSLGLDDHLWRIVEDCWLSEPTERPTMGGVITRLPKRPISTAQLDGIRQYSPDQDLIPWAISGREARTPADESPIYAIRETTPPP